MADIGLVSGTDLGGLTIDTGTVFAWDGRSVPLSFAVDANYSFALPARKEVPNFGLSFGYKSRGFSPPQPVSIVTTPDASIRASARVSGPLWKRTSFGFSGLLGQGFPFSRGRYGLRIVQYRGFDLEEFLLECQYHPFAFIAKAARFRPRYFSLGLGSGKTGKKHQI
jgi:hypothetical protein